VGAATFAFNPKQQAPSAGSWWVVFLDNSDQVNALAYHDLTNEGLPISKVFVKTIQADKASLSVGASHEICEMAVDPSLNSAYQDSQGTLWAGEICDPVEADQYRYESGGLLVTDFVTPNWFGHKNAVGAIDLQQHANTAFQVFTMYRHDDHCGPPRSIAYTSAISCSPGRTSAGGCNRGYRAITR